MSRGSGIGLEGSVAAEGQDLHRHAGIRAPVGAQRDLFAEGLGECRDGRGARRHGGHDHLGAVAQLERGASAVLSESDGGVEGRKLIGPGGHRLAGDDELRDCPVGVERGDVM